MNYELKVNHIVFFARVVACFEAIVVRHARLDTVQHILASQEGGHGFYDADDIVVVQIVRAEDIDVATWLAAKLRAAVLAVESFAADALFLFLFFLLGQALLFLDGTLHDAVVHFLHVDVLNAEACCQQGNLDLGTQ